jgi:hypothetical protein
VMVSDIVRKRCFAKYRELRIVKLDSRSERWFGDTTDQLWLSSGE